MDLRPNLSPRFLPGLVWALGLVGILLGGAAPAMRAAAPALTPRLAFALDDQFKQEHRAATYAGEVVVLSVCDREGSRFSGAWIGALQQALSAGDRTHLRFVAAADLRGVPFFVRGFVRSKFPRNPDQWVLLDWAGALPQAYALPAQCCNLLIFDRRGGLALKLAGREVRPSEVALAAHTIESLLPGHPLASSHARRP